MEIAVFALIVVLIVATGYFWVKKDNVGSFAWKFKTMFFEASAEAKGQENPDVEQSQDNSVGGEQVAVRGVKSKQVLTNSKNSKQIIK